MQIEQGGTKRVSLDEGDVEIGQVRITDGTDIVDVIDLGTYAGLATHLLDSSGNPISPATSGKQDTIIGHLDGVEALLTAIEADTTTLAGAVSGTEMQVDIVTIPTVTVQATNLDIRDLSSVSDSVAAVQSGAWTVDTELPTAAALTDDTANPTVPGVGAFLMGYHSGTSQWDRLRTSSINADDLTGHTEGVLDVMSNNFVYDGAGWDRMRGDATDGVLVNLGANNDVAITSILPGSGATNLGKAEDAGHTTGDIGVAVWGVRNDTLAQYSNSNNDYTPLAVEDSGRQFTRSSLEFGTAQQTFTGTGASSSVDLTKKPLKFFSLQVTETGTVTSWTVDLQVSNNGSNWTNFLQHTKAGSLSGTTIFSADAISRPCLFFRVNVSALTLGAGTNIVVNALGVQ